MRIRLILVLFFLIYTSLNTLFAQQNREATISGHSNDEYLYFDSLQKITMHKLKSLDGSVYEFYISFKIDTSANVVDFKISEMPICKLPVIIKKYIKKLIKSTNGEWLPQVRNSQKEVSDELIWWVQVIKTNQSMSERSQKMNKFIKYYLEQGTKDEIIVKYDKTGKWRIITLTY